MIELRISTILSRNGNQHCDSINDFRDEIGWLFTNCPESRIETLNWNTDSYKSIQIWFGSIDEATAFKLRFA